MKAPHKLENKYYYSIENYYHYHDDEYVGGHRANGYCTARML